VVVWLARQVRELAWVLLDATARSISTGKVSHFLIGYESEYEICDSMYFLRGLISFFVFFFFVC